MLINKHKEILDKISEKYGVPSEIVSVWAIGKQLRIILDPLI